MNVPPVRKEENTIGAQVQVREWSQSSFDVAVPSQEALPVDEEDAEEREDFHQDVVIQRPRARRLTLSGNDMCVVSAGQERRLSRPVSVRAFGLGLTLLILIALLRSLLPCPSWNATMCRYIRQRTESKGKI